MSTLLVHLMAMSTLLVHLIFIPLQTKESKSKEMARTSVKVKQNPQLKQRILADGRAALYLEYYEGRTQEPRLDAAGQPMFYPDGTKMAGRPMFVIKHYRKKQELKLYLIAKPKTPEERERNAQTIELAERIRQEQEQALLKDRLGYRVNTHKNDNIIAFFDTYAADYTKKDLRNVRLAVNRFKTFIRQYRPLSAIKKSAVEIEAIKSDWAARHKDINGKHDINENEFYRFSLKPGQLNSTMVKSFVDYLNKISYGEGAATTFSRFKKVVKSAVDMGLLQNNPCAGITCQRNDVLTKDVLTADEMAALISTHYAGENPEIRRAFIMSLYTGIRFCDVKELRYSNIDYTATPPMLSFEQAKTKGHSRASRVYLQLRKELLELIGTPEQYGKNKDDLIFSLPSHTMCLKALKRWTTRAGIEKHITWHCARHSFATNVLTNGANVAVVADLLGHSGLRYVEKYTRALDDAKIAALNSLPSFNL